MTQPPSASSPAPAPRPSYARVEVAETNAQAAVLPAPPAEDDGIEKVAVIVTHGMGQQVPFETLEFVADAIRRAAIQRHPGIQAPSVATRNVRFGIEGKPVEQQLPRAEIRLTLPNERDKDDSKGKQREIHFYEVYWAPLTEGKVTIRDFSSFVLSAGILGIWNTWAGEFFDRWMFGEFQRFVKKTWTLFLSFLMAIAVFLSLVAINGTIGAVATTKMVTGGGGNWPSVEQRAALTLEMLIVIVLFLCIAIGVLLPRFILRSRRFPGRQLIAWSCVWIGLLGLPIVAGFILRSLVLPPTKVPLGLTLLERGFIAYPVWAIVLGASWYVRGVLVQYAGDVAAYVNSHKVSKFWEVRKSIYETAARVFDAVYKSRRAEKVIYSWERYSPDGKLKPEVTEAAPRFQYEKVFVVGHSLGSVISYDALNGLMLEDELSAPPMYIAQRTKLLLTFGSPLDKTAFIFRTHTNRNSEIREASAAAVQPMITSYAHRPRRWVNIFSHNDWVSGSLEFYDTNPPPESPVSRSEPSRNVPVAVENIEDPDAESPLLAHIQYWENPLFREVLYTALTEP